MATTANPAEQVRILVDTMQTFLNSGGHKHFDGLAEEIAAVKKENTDLHTTKKMVVKDAEDNRKLHAGAEDRLRETNAKLERASEEHRKTTEQLAATIEYLSAVEDKAKAQLKSLDDLGEVLKKTKQQLAAEQKLHDSAVSARKYAEDAHSKTEKALQETQERLGVTSRQLANLESKAVSLNSLPSDQVYEAPCSFTVPLHPLR